MREPMLTSSPALVVSLSQPELMECEPSPCAKATPAAKPFSQKRGRESRSGRTLEPSAWTTPQAHDLTGRSDHQKEIHGTKHGCACLVQDLKAAWPTPDASAESGDRRGKNPGQNRQDGSKRSIPVSELLPTSGSLPLAFPASQPHGPGSSEARKMTGGSGDRLSRSLQQSDPLGPFLKTLLGCKTFSSMEFNLEWTATAIPRTRWERWLTVMDQAFSVKSWTLSNRKDTPSKHSVFLLAPSAPRTGECDTGLFASGWPTVTSRDGEHNPKASQATMERNSRPLNEVLYANWPTPRTEDSESTGAHRGTPDTLTIAAKIAGWPTPKQPQGSKCRTEKNMGHLHRMDDVTPTHGEITSGCLARTEKFVERLTTLSAWLMGYTARYLAHWETASSGRSPRKSSKP